MTLTLDALGSQLVVHAPHASLVIPQTVREHFLLDDEALAHEAHLSADLWTDVLARAAWPAATHVAAAVSRLVVDVERFPDDAQEVMARVGRGVVYTHAHDGTPMRPPLRPEERDALVAAYHAPHWKRLRASSAGKVLVDLHSYPVEAWPIELAGADDRPEIDLGTDPALSPESWQAALRQHFEQAGYRVGFNTPYAGVIDAGATAAVMIEIRRDMLGSGPSSPDYLRLVETLNRAPAPSP